MQISGVSNLFHAHAVQPQPQIAQEFQQLVRSPVIQSAAVAPSAASTASAAPQSTFLTPPGSSPIAQLLSQFAQGSPASNGPTVQQDYAAPQSTQGQTSRAHLHHHHGGGSGQSNELSQLFEQLGQDLQAGSLTEAQQAYSALVTDLPQTSAASTTQPTTSGVSVTT